MGKFDYFAALESDKAMLFTSIFNEFWRFLREDRQADVRYHTCLNKELKDLHEYVADLKGEAIPEFSCNFPMGGMVYSDNVGAKGKNPLKQDTKDAAYVFDGITAHPVYFLCVNVINIDYVDVAPLSYRFLAAYSEGEAREFLTHYYATIRNKHKRAVMNYRGNRIKQFRKMAWENIFLPNTMGEDIRQHILDFFESEDMYRKHNLDWRMGFLFAGPPGNGKTAVCRAVATESEVPVIYCALDDDMYSVMLSLQETTAEQAPCVVIIEDADTLGAEPAMRSNFLNMLDGLFTVDGVLTIASTNCPEKLDPAFTGRPSRFDYLYHFRNPEKRERKAIFLGKLGDFAENLDGKEVDELVDKMEGLSAAAVQEVSVKALRTAFRDGEEVTLQLLNESFRQVQEHMTTAEEGFEKLSRGSFGFAPVERSLRFPQ